jgi:hypothetical protein
MACSIYGGVVHEYVKAAEFPMSLIDHGPDRIGVRQIGAHDSVPVAGQLVADLGRQFR